MHGNSTGMGFTGGELTQRLALALVVSLVGCSSEPATTPSDPDATAPAAMSNDSEATDVVRPDDDTHELSTDITTPGDVLVTETDDGSYVCTPAGTGPFPGVLYNHGGLAMAVGGDLEGTCRALAEAGYLGYSKQRRLTQSRSLMGHIDDVYDGLDAMMAHGDVDTTRIGIMGFSRGGMLALGAATERTGIFSAIVSMAPASANGKLAQALENADKIDAPVLVLVSENDLYQDDHVTLAQNVADALEAEGKPVEHIIYPPFGDDGHERFFTVGSYWSDITTFLAAHL